VAWTSRYWNTLAMLGVAMFSLMVLRSVVKSAPAAASTNATGGIALAAMPEEPTQHAGGQHAAAEQTPAAATSDDRPRLRLKKGSNVKDDLVEIVREDPDAAADILRSWISKAG
jgi:flagellar M-ring protein FliF